MPAKKDPSHPKGALVVAPFSFEGDRHSFRDWAGKMGLEVANTGVDREDHAEARGDYISIGALAQQGCASDAW